MIPLHLSGSVAWKTHARFVLAWWLVLGFWEGTPPVWGVEKSAWKVNLDRYSLKEGFSSNRVRRLFLDSRGFLWVGTQDGLNRFDGRQVRLYKHSPSDRFSLSGNLITALAEDHQGNILVGTGNGLDRLQVQTGRFEKVLVSEAGEPEAALTVNDLYVEKGGTIWAAVAGQGLVQMDAAGKLLNRYAHDPDNPHSLAQNHILCIKPAHDGRLLLGLGGGGLSIYDRKTGEFHNYRFGSATDDPSFRANVVRDILEDAHGHLWLASYGGLHRFDPQTRTWEHFTVASTAGSLTENSLHKIIASPGGGYLLATYGGGLVHLDPEQKAFTRLHDASLDQLGAHAFFDLHSWNNIVWAGSSSSGLLKLAFLPPYIKPITASSLGLPNEMDADMTALASGKEGHLWVALKGRGLFRCTPGQAGFAPQKESGARCGGALAGEHITNMQFDLRGTLWMASYRNGLFSLDTASREVRHFTFGAGDPHIPHMAVNALAVDHVGDVWIGTAFGLSRWDAAAQRMHSYFVSKAEAFHPQSPIISKLHTDQDGRVFIITEKDFLIYKNGTFEAISPQNAEDQPFEALSIAESGDQTYWIGTGTGLLRMVLRPDHAAYFTDFQHVPNMARLKVNGVTAGEHGLLWLSTQLGLFSFEPGEEKLRHYPVGLPDESPGISQISPDLAGIGHLFRSPPAWMSFDPVRARAISDLLHASIDRVQLGSLRLDDQVLSQALEKSFLQLPYGQHVLTIDFTARHHVTPHQVTFQYRLLGLSPTWTDLGDQHRLTLAGLSPGSYELQMKAFSLGSVPSAISHFSLQIEAPIWQKWWFIGLALLAFLAILWLIYRYDLNRKLELEKLRNGIARDLHDEVGATLTKISLFAELSLTLRDTPQGSGYLHKISELGRSAVEGLGEIVWATDARNDQMGNLFNRIQDQALDMLSARDIRFDFCQNDIADQLPVTAHVRQHLYLICKEAIHNVAKHSNGNQLSIHFSKAGNTLSLTIADNGEVLLGALETARGNGLANIRTRVAALGGKVDFRTVQGFCIAISEINLNYAKANIGLSRR